MPDHLTAAMLVLCYLGVSVLLMGAKCRGLIKLPWDDKEESSFETRLAEAKTSDFLLFWPLTLPVYGVYRLVTRSKKQ
jgi:hypothetical protein